MAPSRFPQEEISLNALRINEILASDIFEPADGIHPLRQSAFIELILCLNDLLQKAHLLGVPVGFTDSVDVGKDIANVTDLVRQMRDAVCHITSRNNLVEVVGFNVFSVLNIKYGKGRLVELRVSGSKYLVLESEYEDDVCFFFGKLRIYLNHHIIRAFNEVNDESLRVVH